MQSQDAGSGKLASGTVSPILFEVIRNGTFVTT
jgi:hypothetical protein